MVIFFDLYSQEWAIYIPKLQEENSVWLATFIRRMTEESPFPVLQRVSLSGLQSYDNDFLFYHQTKWNSRMCQVLYIYAHALTQIQSGRSSGLSESSLSKIIYVGILGNHYSKNFISESLSSYSQYDYL